jgi:hypothetical protein
MGRRVAADFFVQVKAKVSERWNGKAGEYLPYLEHLTADTITQKRPNPPKPGHEVVKIRIYFPEEMFLKAVPEAIINVPDDFIDNPVTVEATVPE